MGKLLVVMVLSCGCSAGASLDQLRVRAAFDFDCPRERLAVANIDKEARGVTGCGQRRTYIQDCEHEDAFGVRRGCTWILNASRP